MAARDAAVELAKHAEAARREIAEMDAASDLLGLDEASEVASCSGRMELVRCRQCNRIMISEALQGHLFQCKKARAPSLLVGSFSCSLHASP